MFRVKRLMRLKRVLVFKIGGLGVVRWRVVVCCMWVVEEV